MKPMLTLIQCILSPFRLAQQVALLKLEVSRLEQANLVLQTKPEAQLRRIQAERDGRKTAHPAHVYDQLILQESVHKFMATYCESPSNPIASTSDLYHRYCDSLEDSPKPKFLEFTLALRHLESSLGFQIHRAASGHFVHPPSSILPPSFEEEPKLSDAMFPKGATGPRPVPHPEEADSSAFAEPDEHDQLEQEWLTRLPHSSSLIQPSAEGESSPSEGASSK
jgi:hypothetical protein